MTPLRPWRNALWWWQFVLGWVLGIQFLELLQISGRRLFLSLVSIILFYFEKKCNVVCLYFAAQGEHELSGNEDPSILHANIAYLPSKIAYKEGVYIL